MTQRRPGEPIAGVFYDGASARAYPARLHAGAAGDVRVYLADREVNFAAAQVRIAARVGTSARSVYFENGAKFETRDNDAVDHAFARTGVATGAGFLHTLETHKRYIVIAVVATVLSTWVLIQFGIPTAAKSVAFALPAKTNSLVGQGALALLDKMLAPTDLDAATQKKYRAHFATMSAAVAQPGVDYRLLFRRGGAIGANAFALPTGTVVVTDELIALAKHEHEVVAVLAHEIGHVHNRHGLRHAIQGSAIALATLLVAGDISSTSYAIAALPTVLVNAQYSQAFEREADAYARDYLRAQRIDGAHFKNFMRRLDATHGGSPEWARYIASHPPTQERIDAFR